MGNQTKVIAKRRRSAWLVVLASGAAFPGLAIAQSVAPSQVTPREIAPQPREMPRDTLLPPAVPAAPTNDSALMLETGDVEIEGGFDALAKAHAALVARVGHQRLSLAELFEAARALEQAYARQGYILVRVTLPPQRLAPGAAVRVLVIDGFVEDIDLANLAAPLREAVRMRVAPLIGQKQLTQAMIERALLLAGDLAGARLRSALAPGSVVGGVRLVVEGQYERIEAQLGADNGLPQSLGTWQLNTSLVFNNPFGSGDQLYLSLGSQARLGRYGFPKSALAMIGGGIVVPLNRNGLSLTGEFLHARTQPNAVAGVPYNIGQFSRGLIRLRAPLVRTRAQSLTLSSSVEMITQAQKLPDFGVSLNRDHYGVIRVGLNWQRALGAVPLTIDTQLSQGISGRSPSVLLPVSRSGTRENFTRLEASAHLALPVVDGFWIDLTARGQTGFGRAQLLPEQFSLDARNALSGFTNGSLSVDSGATVRGELRYPMLTRRSLTISPYAFGAGGVGRLMAPTALERRDLTASTIGFGARIGLTGAKARGATLGIEFAQGFSNIARQRNSERVNISFGLRF